jgi:nanoRNase/pAp phosphatase (c-di-AMP/oligoRNAs hydrolase)
MMAEKHNAVSGVFDIRGSQVRLSFRSLDHHTPSAFDIASSLGGGGHKNAAGASIARDDFLKMLR